MRAGAVLAWWALVLALLLLAPLPLGGVNTWWSMPLAALAIVLGAAMTAAPALVTGRLPSPPAALLPLGAFALLVLLTVLRLPEGLVSFLSPARASIPPLPEGTTAGTLSAYPGGTVESGVLHLGAFYLLWAAATRSPAASLRVLAVVGSVHAVLGVALAEAGWTTNVVVFRWYPLPEVLTPFGTYVNKNHFAGLMIVGAGANLALVLSHLRAVARELPGAGALAVLARASRGDAWRWVVPGIGFLACVLAIFASGSRGAALALTGALLAIAVLSGLARRRLRWWPVALVVVLVTGAALAAQVGSSQSVLERLVPGGRYMNRPRLWKDTLGMAADHPVFGTGLGTFPYIIPRYQSFDSEREFTHAEGDWIQYVAETGILGTLLILAFAVAVLHRVWRGLSADGRNRGLAMGAGVGILGVALHGFVDSSLHIPANFLPACVLAGSILAMAGGRAAGSPDPDRIGGDR